MLFYFNSYAKFNFFLDVKEKRRDSYHEISTLMGYLDICDRITINTKVYGSGLNIKFTGKYGYKLQRNIKNNLITKAFEIIHRKYGISIDCDVIVEKNIPLSSGMGGGSSNAGAIINFCNQYFGLEMTSEDKTHVAKFIGSDVPFFTQNEAAMCYGKGEIIQPVKIADIAKQYSILVIDPSEKVSTKQVYEGCRFSMNKDTTNQHVTNFIEIQNRMGMACDPFKVCAFTENDLTKNSMPFSNRILKFVSSLDENQDIVFKTITGAGSTCIIAYNNQMSARSALTHVNIAYPGMYTNITTFLPSVKELNNLNQIGRYNIAC